MKKKILRLVAVIMLISMLFILTGCSNKENGERETKSNNKKLSDVVKIGDYVEYKTEVGKIYTSIADKTGIDKEQVFETTGEEKWRVLSIEDDGSINLVSADGIVTKFDKEYSLYGEIGYANAVEELNNISKIYATGDKAISGRSMNLSDIVTLIGIDKIAKVYENENEVDLSAYKGEEKLEQVYKLMNEEYGNTYTFDNKTKTVNSAFNISSSMNAFGIDKITDDKNVIDLLKISNGKTGEYIWLADEITDVGKVGREASYFKCGLATYDVTERTQYNGYTGETISSSIGYQELYYINEDRKLSSYPDNFIRVVVTLDKDTRCIGGTGTIEDAYTLK